MLTPLNVLSLLVVTPVALALAATPFACWLTARDRRADRAHWAAGDAARDFAVSLTADAAARDAASTRRAGYWETPDEWAARTGTNPTRLPKPPKEGGK